ncbi:uncharacterized protein LOC144994726 [Oryzias latipes]
MTERSGQTPDPADPEGLRVAVNLQGIALGRQADALSQIASAQQELFRRLDGLTQTLTDLTGQMSTPSPTATLPAASNASTSASAMTPENFRLQPEPFLGNVEACGGFLLQCHLLFQQAPRPGSRNVKPDALSRKYCSSDELDSTPANIIPQSYIIGSLTWDIETKVLQAQGEEPDHPNPPNGTLYVPQSLRSDTITWAHSSRIACHWGVARTLNLLRRRFFWPSMGKDVREYVAACPTCARSKSSNNPPSGLLHPLPTPSRPWSHIAVDFVTGLPPSQGNSVIFTVIDRFSKFVHFIPLPQLPTATETAEILVQQVFRHHGIPTDIVSDRGPQFVSQVWKAFCSALGASVSLTSGYHPQSNGQAERLRELIRSWKPPFAVWPLRIPWTGRNIWYGPNTHITLTRPLPQDCPRLRPPSGTHHHCFPRRSWTWQCPRFRTIFGGAKTSGTKPGLLSSAPRRATAVLLTATGWPPHTCLVNGFGCPHVTYPSMPRHVSLLPVTSVLTLLRRSSIPPVSASGCPLLSRSTRPSIFPRSNLFRTARFAPLPHPLHPPGSLTMLLPTPSAASWTSDARVVATNSWWIGRVTVRRNVPGSLAPLSWTLPSSGISIVPTRIGALARLEAVVEGGVLSWCLWQTPPPPALFHSSPDCHQLLSLSSSSLLLLRSSNASSRRQIVNPYGDSPGLAMLYLVLLTYPT